jgi:hypothetical protein
MKYLVYILIVPWLVYSLYEDWKDAHKTRPQQSKSHLARKILRYRRFAKLGSGRFLLMLGFVAIAP